MKTNAFVLLDVAIGLVFIFFVFSLFVSGIVELINTFMEQRAKLLRIALDKLLGTPLSDAFFSHKLTNVKQQRFWGAQKPINYLSADSFSTVLIDLMSKAGQAAGVQVSPAGRQTAQTLAAIRQGLQHTTLRDARDLIEPILAKSDDFQMFKTELEKWYNGYMEQVSGWFKRYAQGVVWLVSAVMALGMNVDTIHIAGRLFNDDGLRERVVAQAVSTAGRGGDSLGKNDSAFRAFLKNNQATLLEGSTDAVKANLTPSEQVLIQSAYVQFVKSQIDDLQLPISWKWAGWRPHPQPGQTVWSALMGWILTTAALSFGAPFWFDLLLKLVNIRNTARRPPGNPEPAK